jgi:adenosyl cobinamide kinase/adenosyl cobinamide phosphate guanylyltransferase
MPNESRINTFNLSHCFFCIDDDDDKEFGRRIDIPVNSRQKLKLLEQLGINPELLDRIEQEDEFLLIKDVQVLIRNGVSQDKADKLISKLKEIQEYQEKVCQKGIEFFVKQLSESSLNYSSPDILSFFRVITE